MRELGPVKILGVFENLDSCFEGHLLVQKYKTDRSHFIKRRKPQRLNHRVICGKSVRAEDRFGVETEASDLRLD